jgi:tungstate transport system substrate-binding protein
MLGCVALVLALLASRGVAGDYKQIVVATGSPFELGLVQAAVKPFEKETGCAVRVVKTPTGPGLELGKNGLAHITMGHDHAATARFVAEGFAAKRADLMYNVTVIVGPAEDSAKIAGLTDLKEAHKRIAEAKAKYLARGDGGGMNLIEIKMWKELGVTTEGQPWYVSSKKFMLDSLLDANTNGQYHMLDSSTWFMHRAKTPNLKLLVSGPKNEYEMCLVSTEKLPNLKYNQEYAVKLYDWLLSAPAQKIIAEFGKEQYGEAIYYPWPK